MKHLLILQNSDLQFHHPNNISVVIAKENLGR